MCHLIHSLGHGGAEHVLVDLAAAAPAAGLDLSVVSMMPTEGAAHADQLRAIGVPVRSLDLPNRWDPRGLARGLVTVRHLRPDVVHTHLKHADLVGAHVASRLGVPMVSTLHLIEDGPTPLGRLKRRLAARARNRHAAVTIAVSEALRRWYLSAFGLHPDRVVTVRNGVADGGALPGRRRTAIRAELGVRGQELMAVFVGLMRPGKGHDELLDAVEQLPARLGVRFVLAGDGPLRAGLEARVRERPYLAARVVFAGYRSDVDAVLRSADLLVHPSRFDALPTAVIHGLAAGLPTVASRVGGIPEIVAPDAGVLVPAGDAGALARAVSAVAADPPLRARMGAAARRRFDAEFAADAWARRLRTQYERVLPRR